MRKRVLFYMRTTKAQISLCIRHPSSFSWRGSTVFGNAQNELTRKQKCSLHCYADSDQMEANSRPPEWQSDSLLTAPAGPNHWQNDPDQTGPALYLHCLPRHLRTNHVVITIVSFCHTTTCSLCEDIVIIIITLFQEDKIFGTNDSLTYGPQIQKRICVW